MLGLLALVPAAPAQDPLQEARERSGFEQPLPTRFALPAGEVRISPTEFLASTGPSIEFTATLDRPAPGAAVAVRLPAEWRRTPARGLPRTRALRLGTARGGLRAGARLTRDGNELELRFTGRETRAAFTLDDVGIPAGTWRLPLEWRPAKGRRAQTLEPARVRIFAQEREEPGAEEGLRGPWARLPDPGLEKNVTGDDAEESETYLAVTPFDADRVFLSVNGSGAAGDQSAFVSNDGGSSWTERDFSTTLDEPGTATDTVGAVICCDPMIAADRLGNAWVGTLATTAESFFPDRVIVNRIAAGSTTFRAKSVALPRNQNSADKPMMTIDESPSSPTFGRLYVVWNEAQDARIEIVLSACDTRVAGIPDPARCDNADNWSPASTVTSAPGSYIYADVAAGPDGRVYVVWWDFSSANQVAGRVCNPAVTPGGDCRPTSAWSATPVRTIAALDRTNQDPVPFACPILAQPGGRAAPATDVAVDHSGGPKTGRVYVTWSDLTGPGTTRCDQDENGFGTTPLATHKTFDSYVATAVDDLPGVASPRTKILGEGASAPLADRWFAGVAVDQTTGQAWVDVYSTEHDNSRQTAHFHARSVDVSAGGAPTLGPDRTVSTAPSDYSGNPCCTFGNDYGDYSNIDATEGLAYPVWSDNRASTGGDGEAFGLLQGAGLQLTNGPTTPTEAAGDGDGTVEAGELASVTQRVDNPSGVTATGVSASLAPTLPAVGVEQGTSAYPNIGSGANATNTSPFSVRLPAALGVTNGAEGIGTTAATVRGIVLPDACGTIDLRLTVTANEGTERLPVNVPVACSSSAGAQFLFQYGPVSGAGFPSQTAPQAVPAGTGPRPVSATLAGLTPGTPYRFRVVAQRGAAPPVPGQEGRFTTGGTAPGPGGGGDTPTPTPTPTPGPSGGPGPDRVAPRIGSGRFARRRLADLRSRRRGIRLDVTVSEAATVRGRLLLTRSVARRLGLRTSGTTYTLRTARVTLTRAGTARLVFRLTPTQAGRLVRRLRRLSTLRVSIAVDATDASGNRARRTFRATLRR